MQDQNTPLRRCAACGKDKGLEEFARDPNPRDGIRGKCRACEAIQRRRYLEAKTIERPAIAEGEKRCVTCEEIKPLTDFQRAPRYTMGVASSCKKCRSEYGKKRKQKIKVQQLEPPAEKRCPRCGIVKPAEAFSTNRMAIDKLQSRCRECRTAWWHALPPEQRKERGFRASLRSLYRLDEEGYGKMLAEQKGQCAICDKHMIRPEIDHDHVTGKIRGILCAACNRRLALIENSELLEKSLKYLGRV